MIGTNIFCDLDNNIIIGPRCTWGLIYGSRCQFNSILSSERERERSVIPDISHNRHNHGGVLFSSRCTFFHRERDKDCFQQSLFREYKHKYAKQKAWTQSKTPNTPKKQQIRKKNTKYAKNTKYSKFSFTLFCREIFLSLQNYALFGVLFIGIDSAAVYQK